jgi:hypothetical protein
MLRWLWPVLESGMASHCLEHLPVSDAPDPVPRSAVDEFPSPTYEVPGKLEARAYALDSPALRLELVARWSPSADTVFILSVCRECGAGCKKIAGGSRLSRNWGQPHPS